MIAIVDYDTGNLRSVANALERLGEQFVLTSSPQVLSEADHVILPGVGEASSAMQKLRDRGLDTFIPTLRCPVLGICIGMQLMCESSDEGSSTDCMGIFPSAVTRLVPDPAEPLKIPHMGWDTVGAMRGPLFDGIADGTYFYFVHSYAASLSPATSAVTDYCRPFSAACSVANFHGVQFHPEKSGEVGAKLLSNFLKL